MKKLVVVGSLNMDLVMEVERMPKVGETIKGNKMSYFIGGKGSNQAVAASRLEDNVKIIGCVGKDTFGEKILKHLKEDGVNVESVREDNCAFTGLATIFKTPEDNSIVVIPGANDFCDIDLIKTYEDVIKDADVVITQLEIPMETVEYALKIAKKHGVKTILNPAPVKTLSKEIINNVDFITPNETEFEIICGQSFNNGEELEESMVKWQEDNSCNLIVTRGKHGSSYVKDGKVITIDAIEVKVVDTTGAGDTFNGAFAHCIANEFKIEEAVRFAGIAASLSVRKLGAQSGMPTLKEVNEYFK